MFMAGLGANFQYDLRKIIALSTLNQLGLMGCYYSYNKGFPGYPFYGWFIIPDTFYFSVENPR
jgi:NADH:ubiquinone oxidoreductase subunit 5 (subunit L)/multisubunit Na+/H+ antiporter MnhA subunit